MFSRDLNGIFIWFKRSFSTIISFQLLVGKMDFIEQEAECSDSDSSVSSTDEQGEDLESFIDNQEYDDDESSAFTSVVRPVDGDSQLRLYDRESVDGRDIDNFEKDTYRAERFRKTLLCFSEQ